MFFLSLISLIFHIVFQKTFSTVLDFSLPSYLSIYFSAYMYIP